MSNLYAERDIIEQGDHYSRHTSAMTSEGLHSKSAIAAELAHRDIQLEQAQARVAELESTLYDASIQLGRIDKAHILRKQAEAVEAWAKDQYLPPDEYLTEVGWHAKRIYERANDYAQRLRQQADEAERAGGKQRNILTNY